MPDSNPVDIDPSSIKTPSGDKPVVAKKDSASLQHVGDCHGASVSIDISWHLDPLSYLEIEVLASFDAGKTYSLSLGKAGRLGGVLLSPVTHKPLAAMTFECTGSLPFCKDPLLKVVTRTSKGTVPLTDPVFSGVTKAQAEALNIK